MLVKRGICAATLLFLPFALVVSAAQAGPSSSPRTADRASAATQTAPAKPVSPEAALPAAARGNAGANTAANASANANANANASTSANTSASAGANTASDCAQGPCEETPEHIASVNPPPPAPAGWPLQDRIKWLAVVLLVLIAYIGVWLGLTTLRRIEQQTRYAEEAAQAAAETARAALLFAENQVRAERPWILVTATPTPGSVNSFSVMATNRGRSPARIVSLADCIAIVQDEAHLPPAPVFKTAPHAPTAPSLLLPGESISIKSFNRDELKTVCENAEEIRRIEEWEEKIFLYGVVVYADLAAPEGKNFETGWCAWYIHGRQKSGMILAGPPEYNRHT